MPVPARRGFLVHSEQSENDPDLHIHSLERVTSHYAVNRVMISRVEQFDPFQRRSPFNGDWSAANREANYVNGCA